MILFRLLGSLLLLMTASAAIAHEFWIDPIKFQVERGENVEAQLRNGELFKGSNQPFIQDRTTRFELFFDGKIIPVPARLGDIPALQRINASKDGLLVVAHEAAPSTVTYTNWEKFLKFAKHKDFTNAEADHLAAGWSTTRFRESYTRHSKSLIAIGTGEGADQQMGMETEFIALTNPYDLGQDMTMKVSLSYRAVPRADVQVEVYARTPDRDVDVKVYRTDAKGIVTFPVAPGLEYLVDSVVLRPAPAPKDENDPVWETLWASLTFAVPRASE